MTDDELDAESLLRRCDPGTFEFESTEELAPMDGVIGQDRAMRAVSFGMDIDSPGYHVYAMGAPGTGRIETLEKVLREQAEDESVPADWCYVKNFDASDRPRALRLPPGRGMDFRADMQQLAEQLRSDVPQAFESQEYEQERDKIWEEFRERRQELFEELEQEAQSENLTLLQTQHGIVMAPVQDGEVVTPDEFNELDEETREHFERVRGELQDELRATIRRVQQMQSEVRQRMQELDRRMLGYTVEPLLESLKEEYAGQDAVLEFLDEVKGFLMENVEALKRFQQAEEMQQQQQQQGMPFAMMSQDGGSIFDELRVNLLVDHAESGAAPVVHETNPTYYNLVGRIEHRGQFGTLTTDYSMIKEGALHRANGGYLILEARDLLTTPFAWDALKRALNTEQIKTEAMGQEYRAIQTQTLEPETIPLDVKVVLIGDPLLYYLLYNVDDEFQKLFRVKADFAAQTDWDEETVNRYARYVGSVCREDDLLHFDPSGVARLVQEGARAVADQEKLAAKTGDLADLIRQASFWASENGHDHVTDEDVQRAVEERTYRSNRVEERLREMIRDGTIKIDTRGTTEGQINGISVISLGDYRFGKPSRITARTHAGSEGVLNLEREANMGGRIHNKGVMILSGYLGGLFAQDVPLTLSARITFEQLYEEVEGDSASSAELYALLSSLSGYELRQDLAVTGSVNQRGEIQAIGGVNEKIEGFFHVCEQKGLTGDQGVIIPRSNVRHLMLRRPVVEAVEQGKFHVYPVETVEEGIERLTGHPAGERRDDGTFPDGTVKRAVKDRLRELGEAVRAFNAPPGNPDGSGER